MNPIKSTIYFLPNVFNISMDTNPLRQGHETIDSSDALI